MILKARQTGMSQVCAFESLHNAAYKPGATELFVSKNLKAATNLLRYVKASLPLVEPALRTKKDNETEIVFANGSRIVSEAASPSAGRSYAATDVYLDEFAFLPFGLQIYQSVHPTVSRGGRLTVLSTPYGQNNPFYLLWAGQLGGEGDWSRHVIHWSDCPEFDQAWYERERPHYTASAWATEFECNFEESGQAVFRPRDVERCSEGWLGLQPPRRRRDYVTGWDIGRRHDATVGITLDITSDVHQVVAFDRFVGVPFPVIQHRIAERDRLYPGVSFVEQNSIGDPVIENTDVHTEPFVTSAKSKANAIMALQLAHENGTFKHSIEQLRAECLTYRWDDHDITQDSVMAAAIAEYMAPAAKGQLVQGYALR